MAPHTNVLHPAFQIPHRVEGRPQRGQLDLGRWGEDRLLQVDYLKAINESALYWVDLRDPGRRRARGAAGLPALLFAQHRSGLPFRQADATAIDLRISQELPAFSRSALDAGAPPAHLRASLRKG